MTITFYSVDTLQAASSVYTVDCSYQNCGWCTLYDTALSQKSEEMADIKLFVLCVAMVVVCLELKEGQAQGDA